MTQKQMPSWVWGELEGYLEKTKTKQIKMSLGKVSNSSTGGFWRHVSAEFSKIFSIYTFSNADAIDQVSL